MARCLEVAMRAPLAPPRPACGERSICERSHGESEANRVRGLVHKLRPAATPPHPDSFAALGIRPLPARGERWRKWLCLAPQDTNSNSIALPQAGRGAASGTACANYPQPRRLKCFASFRFGGQRALDAVTRVTFVLWCLCTGGHEAKSGVEDVSPAALPYSRSSG